MKTTKSIIVFFLTFIFIWVSLGFVVYLLSDLSYRECMRNPGVFIFLLIFGWIIPLIVAEEYYKTQKI